MNIPSIPTIKQQEEKLAEIFDGPIQDILKRTNSLNIQNMELLPKIVHYDTFLKVYALPKIGIMRVKADPFPWFFIDFDDLTRGSVDTRSLLTDRFIHARYPVPLCYRKVEPMMNPAPKLRNYLKVAISIFSRPFVRDNCIVQMNVDGEKLTLERFENGNFVYNNHLLSQEFLEGLRVGIPEPDLRFWAYTTPEEEYYDFAEEFVEYVDFLKSWYRNAKYPMSFLLRLSTETLGGRTFRTNDYGLSDAVGFCRGLYDTSLESVLSKQDDRIKEVVAEYINSQEKPLRFPDYQVVNYGDDTIVRNNTTHGVVLGFKKFQYPIVFDWLTGAQNSSAQTS